MNKISYIASGLLLASTLVALDIHIQPGWQLLGATQDLNTTKFDDAGCVDYLWKYNNTATTDAEKWQLHISNNNITTTTQYTPIESLHAGDGYWVKGNNISGCDVNTSSVYTTTKLLAGKTLYTTVYDEMGTLESMEFGNSMDSSTWIELVGGSGCSGTGYISNLKDKSLTFNPVTDSCEKEPDEPDYTNITFTNILSDYINISVEGIKNSSVVYSGEQRLYFDRTKAEEYLLQQLQSKTTYELLAGKTLYTTIYNTMNTLESWEFNSDMTASTWVELAGGSDTGSGQIINLQNSSFAFNDPADGAITVSIESIEIEYLTISIAGGASQRLYFNRAKAEAYFMQ